MAFIEYLFKYGTKCRNNIEVGIQTRLLYNLFFGLMTKEEVMHPLAANMITQAESLDFNDTFERKRMAVYAKSKVRIIFPNVSLFEFLNLPKQHMEALCKIAQETYDSSASAENAQAEQVLKALGLNASKEKL